MTLKYTLLLAVSAALCLGVSCTITGDDNGAGDNDDGDTQTTLDAATALITITQTAGGSTADVTATIEDDAGRTVELTNNQTVRVNDVELSAPDAGDEYTATTETASQYEIAVVEPTVGVQYTTIDAPTDFEITVPAEGGEVSLTGFTLTWSQPNPNLQVRIRLTQTLGGINVTETLPLMSDTGTRDITDDDLADFGQGTNLVITVTKINIVDGIDGFESGELRSEVSTTRSASPRF